MQKQVRRFLLRWVINGLGIWIAGRLFESVSFDESLGVVLGAGLVLALVNAVIKPLLVILSLPAILLSLGLFMVVVNGAVVYIAAHFYGPLEIDGFGSAVLAGLVIGLVNYALTTLLDERG